MVSSSPKETAPTSLPERDDIAELKATVALLETKNQRLSEQVKQMVLIEHQLYASQNQLDAQVRVYRKLYALGKSLNQTFNLAEVFSLASQFVIYQLEFERCLLLLFNPALNQFEVQASDGYYDDESVAIPKTLSVAAEATLVTGLSQNKDYEICTAACSEAALCDWRSHLGMDEYIAFPLRQEAEREKGDVPLGLLIAGNTAERFPYHTRVTPETPGVLGLANAASQITHAINSVKFYQALNEERALLEQRVQDRTQDINDKNKSLKTTLTELKLTQAQLVQSEKMSGLGQLVAGIAHEINNPVSFIYGNLEHATTYTKDLLQLIKTYQTHHPEPHEAVQALMKEIDLNFVTEDLPILMKSMTVGATRIEKIVLSLRTFAHIDEAGMKAVDIHEGLESTLMILDHKLNGKLGQPEVEVIKDYGLLPKVECYAGELNQVFMNILTNASDAFSEAASKGAHRKITITTTAENNHVLIAIADNGPGIPEKIRGNIFNPFFTTKPIGQGTGMGLSISYQIVCDRHHGSLVCESTEGQGTCFIISIPTTQSN